MARYIGASCKLCRREGAKLFLKGRRCNSDKCAFVRRSYPSGQHGRRRIKQSDYGLQLREKQKVKRIYGVLERQFRRYFHEADRTEGVTGEILLQILERRLDNVLLRAGFALSLAEARQIVRYGHVKVDGKKVDIPSYQIASGQNVSVHGKEKLAQVVKSNLETAKDNGAPSWLKVDAANMKAEVLGLPKREDVPFAVQEQLIVELYSK